MNRISKLYHDAFVEKDVSKLKEFAFGCFDRVLCQNKGQSCNSEQELWETILSITFPESKLLQIEMCLSMVNLFYL